MGKETPREPTQAQAKPKKVAGRTSITSKLQRQSRDAQIAELRLLNVPVTAIAKTLKMSVNDVRKSIDRNYKANAGWASVSALTRKYEREQQLEQLDSQLARVVTIDPGVIIGTSQVPQGQPVPAITLRDWLSALEASRRIKKDIITLHGLDGSTALVDKESGQSVPGDPIYEAKIIRKFVESFRETHPHLYEGIIDALIPEPGVESNPDLPLPGGGHFQQDEPDDADPLMEVPENGK